MLLELRESVQNLVCSLEFNMNVILLLVSSQYFSVGCISCRRQIFQYVDISEMNVDESLLQSYINVL